MPILQSYKQFLLKESHPASLGLFRILVGLMLLIQIFHFISNDFVNENFVESKIHFSFYYFEWLPVPTEGFMNFLMLCLALAAGFILIGRWFKLATAIYCIGFTYLWLVDKSYFNNHYYLISLITFLLFFTDATAWGSYKNKQRNSSIPYWQIFLLQAQIFIVFFIAGINKINEYWLIDYQPMRHILEMKAQVDGYDWLSNTGSAAFFSWAGMIYDVVIGFLLWFRKTRKLGVVLFVAFNLMNFWIFHNVGEIGVFPFLLLACLPIFFRPENISTKLSFLEGKKSKEATKPLNYNKRLVIFGVSAYLLIQIILPFRHIFYKDHVDWNGLGQRFAWRMKIMYKDVDMHFYLQDKGDSVKREVNVGHFLNDRQYTNLMYYPDFIPDVANYIREEGMRRGLKDPEVYSTFYIGFNGRQRQLLVDSTLNLTHLTNNPNNRLDWVYRLSK